MECASTADGVVVVLTFFWSFSQSAPFVTPRAFSILLSDLFHVFRVKLIVLMLGHGNLQPVHVDLQVIDTRSVDLVHTLFYVDFVDVANSCRGVLVQLLFDRLEH